LLLGPRKGKPAVRLAGKLVGAKAGSGYDQGQRWR